MEVVHTDKLTKRYKLGGVGQLSLRDTIAGVFTKRRGDNSDNRTVVALDGIDLSVKSGERVGLIGRNGSGKSTLLKILSRITRPTTGRAVITGQVNSLLEVGTGFHLELSGRENIFLNGAVHGMKRADIESRFDQIVEFSEMGRFIDTPVKHYSSGMFMRLGFSVAAHLDPEVLIVDEVLAVGDGAFQRKCIGKMQEFGDSGRTVIFVSHDMGAIARLCKRAIWLQSGKVAHDGPAHETVSKYMHHQSDISGERSWPGVDAPGDKYALLRSVRVLDGSGRVTATFTRAEPIRIEIGYEILVATTLVASMALYNAQGLCLLVSGEASDDARPVGSYVSSASIPGNFLSEGPVFVSVSLRSYSPFNEHCTSPDAVMFAVLETDGLDASRRDLGDVAGLVSPVLDWTTRIDGK